MLANLLEQILIYFHQLTSSYGLSIILLSLAVTIIMFPLYWFAEILQQKERNRKSAMQSGLDEINDLKNKQEKYYYTKELYRQHNYKSYYALTGLIGLAIQVPFFIAAYWMLLEYTPLKGIPFGPIKDLSLPDNIFAIGGMAVNTLPILMTMVNLFSISLQYKYMNKNEAIQLSVIAIVFLVLLYDLPAGMVLYWTMNNVFAIGKNWLFKIFFKPSYQYSSTEQTKVSTWIYSTVDRINIRNVSLALSLIGIYLFLISTMKTGMLYINEFTRNGYYVVLIIFGAIELLIVYYVLKLKINYLLKAAVLVVVYGAYMFSKYTLTYKTISIFYVAATGMIFLTLIISINTILSHKSRIKIGCQNTNVKLNDLLLSWVLLPPLINYHYNNIEYMPQMSAILLYYGVLFLLPVIVLIVIYYYGHFLNRKLAIITIISLALTTYLMPVVTNIYKATANSNFFLHFGTMIVVYSAIISYSYGRKIMAFVVVAAVVLMGAHQLGKPGARLVNSISDDTNISNRAHNINIPEYSFKTKMKYTPDIYLLVYDAFVSSRQMKYYGINNTELEEYLETEGFTLYNNIYSNSVGTQRSMGRVFSAFHNVDTSSTGTLATIFVGNSYVDKILRYNGYQTNYILNDGFIHSNPTFSGDYLYPRTTSNDHTILYSTLIGEFIWNLEFKMIDWDAWEQAQTARIRLQVDNPKFLYSHHNKPGHSQNSGTLLQLDVDDYIEDTKIANELIIDDVEDILSLEKDAIIIIAGDHGPFLTGDASGLFEYKEHEISGLHLIDRFGTFLAIKYPDSITQPDKHDITLLQNIFVYIFSILYEDDDFLTQKVPPITKDYFSSFPVGVINNGIIMYGKDKGKTVEDILEDTNR